MCNKGRRIVDMILLALSLVLFCFALYDENVFPYSEIMNREIGKRGWDSSEIVKFLTGRDGLFF